MGLEAHSPSHVHAPKYLWMVLHKSHISLHCPLGACKCWCMPLMSSALKHTMERFKLQPRIGLGNSA